MKTIIASLLFLLLGSLCQSCVVVPIPASGKTASGGTRIGKSETDFIKPGQTTDAEVIRQLGQPFATNATPAAIAYNWAVISWYWYLVTVFPDRLFDAGNTSERSELLLIQFDSNHRVVRFEFQSMPESQPVKEALERWVKTKIH